jgi:hypothetical protein
MLAFTDVVHFFTHEFASLRRRCFALCFVAPRSF